METGHALHGREFAPGAIEGGLGVRDGGVDVKVIADGDPGHDGAAVFWVLEREGVGGLGGDVGAVEVNLAAEFGGVDGWWGVDHFGRLSAVVGE